MIDPRWDTAYAQAFSMLTEAWEYRLVVSGIITSICVVFGMDEVLVYCMFSTLTADMLLRFMVLLRLHNINTHISICNGLKRGMPRYIHYCTFIVMAWAAQLSLAQATGLRIPLINMMMCYLVLQDLASVAGSLQALNVRIPGILDRAIRSGRRHIDKRVGEHLGNYGNHTEQPQPQQLDPIPAHEAREPYTPAEHPHRRASDRFGQKARRYGEHDGQTPTDAGEVSREKPHENMKQTGGE